MPDTGSRQDGVRPYCWTLREFAREGLLRFAFADTEDARSQVGFVVTQVERALERAARDGDPNDPGLELFGQRLASFPDLVEAVCDNLEQLTRNAAPGTLDAFRRRLHAAAQHMGHLVRANADAARCGIDWDANQVTVIDIHRLHRTTQMFVVGVVLKRMLERKEAQGTARPLVLVVLDELNKYAPHSGWSPLRDVLLDVAERGRSLGVSLFGAQQTVSEVERRVVANAALRVVGRLDAAEAEGGEYGFLTPVAHHRATLLSPGTMIVSQPEIPTPLLVRFPLPAWATRESEARAEAVDTDDPFARLGGD
jgi:DNA helicase HerA-like ATPase